MHYCSDRFSGLPVGFASTFISHLVFHVSQLKKAIGATHQVIADLPSYFALNLMLEQILESRLVPHGTSRIQQVLVKWNNLPPSLATWEDYDALRQEFPRPAAWGQATFQGRGSVSSVPAQAAASSSEDGPATSKPSERPKVQRPKKTNPKYYGGEWAG